MLAHLHVKNLALIEEIEVEFGPGLNILTGETGAGKSILLGSMQLILGAKTSKNMIRENAPYALVELLFQIENEKAKEALKALDIYPEDGQVLLSRKIMDGRSINKINGETSTVSQMKAAAACLLDIHGQHEHQSLLYQDKQLAILDAYGKEKILPAKETVHQAYKEYSKCKSELNSMNMDEEQRNRETAFLEFEIKEIEKANLQSGEDEELERQYRKMNNAKLIVDSLQLIHNLTGYDAKEGMIRDKESTTSYSVVLAIPGIDRIFLHHPGANHTFAVSDIDFDKVKEAAIFHFGYPTLMESMYNNDGAELVHLMKSVQETGAATSLDLAAVDANSKAGQADWAKILGRTLPYVDFFVPSIEELCFMLDRDKFEELQVRADGGDITDVLDIEQDVKPLAEKCITLGCKVLLLKCGAKGMYLQTAGEEKLRQVSVRTELDVAAWAEKAVFEKSYIPEKILSGTGAGDTSIAAFLTAMLEGNTPEMCLHLAAATGASCVAAYDALSGLKSFEELKKKIEEGWEKVC